jgi:ornithine cyclodeaminase/alanine dehydrogenase
VTCTPSKTPFIGHNNIHAGTTIAAVGSDSPDKQELDPWLLKDNKVVVDILNQCASAGELHHALKAGLISIDKVHAEIGEIVIGKKPGRENQKEIIVYDATGTAIQDTAAAIMCFEKATARNIGRRVSLLD